MNALVALKLAQIDGKRIRFDDLPSDKFLTVSKKGIIHLHTIGVKVDGSRNAVSIDAKNLIRSDGSPVEWRVVN